MNKFDFMSEYVDAVWSYDVVLIHIQEAEIDNEKVIFRTLEQRKILSVMCRYLNSCRDSNSYYTLFKFIASVMNVYDECDEWWLRYQDWSYLYKFLNAYEVLDRMSDDVKFVRDLNDRTAKPIKRKVEKWLDGIDEQDLPMCLPLFKQLRAFRDILVDYVKKYETCNEKIIKTRLGVAWEKHERISDFVATLMHY